MVSLDIAGDFGRLRDEIEIAIFRIVHECLTNVHRHSGSRNAIVRIAHGEGRVQVEVRDTGKGIPSEKQETLSSAGGPVSVGFRGMRERIAQLGGLLEIQSDEHGTSEIATVPVRQAVVAAVNEEVA